MSSRLVAHKPRTPEPPTPAPIARKAESYWVDPQNQSLHIELIFGKMEAYELYWASGRLQEIRHRSQEYSPVEFCKVGVDGFIHQIKMFMLGQQKKSLVDRGVGWFNRHTQVGIKREQEKLRKLSELEQLT